jgi:hypothetical protein
MDAGRGSHHVCSYLCHHVYSHADIVRYHLLHVVKVALPPGDASSHAMQLRNTHARARTRTEEQDAHKITSSSTSSAHARSRTEWA